MSEESQQEERRKPDYTQKYVLTEILKMFVSTKANYFQRDNVRFVKEIVLIKVDRHVNWIF